MPATEQRPEIPAPCDTITCCQHLPLPLLLPIYQAFTQIWPACFLVSSSLLPPTRLISPPHRAIYTCRVPRSTMNPPGPQHTPGRSPPRSSYQRYLNPGRGATTPQTKHSSCCINIECSRRPASAALCESLFSTVLSARCAHPSRATSAWQPFSASPNPLSTSLSTIPHAAHTWTELQMREKTRRASRLTGATRPSYQWRLVTTRQQMLPVGHTNCIQDRSRCCRRPTFGGDRWAATP